MCFVILFVASESFSMDEAGQKKKSSSFIEKKIKQKNNMNTQEAVASVFKTGMICATIGGVIYHIANKFHEDPEIWGPMIRDSSLLAGVTALGYGIWRYMMKPATFTAPGNSRVYFDDKFVYIEPVSESESDN